MDLSIIIVNHNTKRLCTDTVKSIFTSTNSIDYEIIIVDNSSKESETFDLEDKRVKILSGVENKGFGNACNIGADIAIGRYVLFLNSDTLVQKDCLKKCVDYLDNNSLVGCLGVRTVLKNGTFDHGCKRGFPTPFNALCYILKLDKLFPKSKKFGGYRLSYLSETETNEVDAVSGAFMMIPRSVLQKSGGFDESIFMYAEDLDLCYKIKELGFKVVYYADTWLIHLKGQSGLKTKNLEVIRHFENGLRTFYDKYYLEKNNFLVNGLVHLGIKLNCMVMRIKAKVSK